MKISWGNWIAVAYSLFVLLIVFMVYMAFGEKWDLVSEDYYEQEIKFQEKIDERSNVAAEGIKPKFFIDESSLVLEFESAEGSTDDFKGQLTFFRPSDAEGDVSFDFQSSKDLKFPLAALQKGKYLVKLSWTDGDKGYYHEQTLIIP